MVGVFFVGACRDASDGERVAISSAVVATASAAPSADGGGDETAGAGGAVADAGVRPPRVRGNVVVRGRLPRAEIERVVRGRSGAFRACYEEGLLTNPGLEARLTVRFVIARDGEMISANASGEPADAAVRKCITYAFYGLSFPEPEGGIVTPALQLVLRRRDGVATVEIAWPPDEPPAAR